MARLIMPTNKVEEKYPYQAVDEFQVMIYLGLWSNGFVRRMVT